jgi:hypothetical protein
VHKHCALNTVRDASHRLVSTTATTANAAVICALAVNGSFSIVALCESVKCTTGTSSSSAFAFNVPLSSRRTSGSSSRAVV